MTEDFVRVKVEVLANGEAADYTIVEPLLIGDEVPVEVAKTAAETAAMTNLMRTLRSSASLIPRTGIVIDRRDT